MMKRIRETVGKVIGAIAALLCFGTATAASYTAAIKDGVEDAANWTISPNKGLAEKDTVTVKYSGTQTVKTKILKVSLD